MSYSIIALDSVAPAAINDTGQIAGYSGGHAILWQNGARTDLGTLGGATSWPYGINNAGQVFGSSLTASGNRDVFRWDPSLGMQDLGLLGDTGVYATNDTGELAGTLGSSPTPHAFLWDSVNGLQDLGTFGTTNSRGRGINNAVQVVGWTETWYPPGILAGRTDAFVWERTSGRTVLDPLPGHNASRALAINNSGQIVGTSGSIMFLGPAASPRYVPREGILWQNGTTISLGTQFVPPAAYADKFALNELGQVVHYHYLWNNGVVTDLNSEIDPSLGFQVGEAFDINNRGEILARGTINGIGGHTFLLSPSAIPAPRSLSISRAVAYEGNSGTVNFVFSVIRTGPSDQITTVAYASADGTASAASDYAAVSGTLTFDLGETSKTITVAVNGDTLSEPNETFFVNLSNPANGFIANGEGVGEIINDDAVPVLSVTISDVTIMEGNSGVTDFVLTVSLSAPSGQTVTVNYNTANGTASAGSDYAAASGTVTFNPGETSKTITALVNGDTLSEANETFFVNLSNPVNAQVADGQGVGTILNDDPVPSLTINDVSQVEGNSGISYFVFTVSLSAASGQTVTVNFATANGTAKKSDNDYVATSGTLTFAPGETTKTILVAVKGDTKKEANETFYLNLSGAVNALLADSQGVGTILNDD